MDEILQNFTVVELRIRKFISCRQYNLHVGIRGYSSMKRADQTTVGEPLQLKANIKGLKKPVEKGEKSKEPNLVPSTPHTSCAAQAQAADRGGSSPHHVHQHRGRPVREVRRREQGPAARVGRRVQGWGRSIRRHTPG